MLKSEQQKGYNLIMMKKTDRKAAVKKRDHYNLAHKRLGEQLGISKDNVFNALASLNKAFSINYSLIEEERETYNDIIKRIANQYKISMIDLMNYSSNLSAAKKKDISDFMDSQEAVAEATAETLATAPQPIIDWMRAYNELPVTVRGQITNYLFWTTEKNMPKDRTAIVLCKTWEDVASFCLAQRGYTYEDLDRMLPIVSSFYHKGPRVLI